jgi:hypothetical protein
MDGWMVQFDHAVFTTVELDGWASMWIIQQCCTFQHAQEIAMLIVENKRI